jgi:hypothetical protein
MTFGNGCTMKDISRWRPNRYSPHTSDHTRDGLDNLIYCCANCNQYKQDYYPINDSDPRLWNPREESTSAHFVELEDGRIAAITPSGEFTIRRLRLNRLPLVGYRKQRRQRAEEMRLLVRYQNSLQLLSEVNGQLSELIEEQQQLLQKQRKILQILLERRD